MFVFCFFFKLGGAIYRKVAVVLVGGTWSCRETKERQTYKSRTDYPTQQCHCVIPSGLNPQPPKEGAKSLQQHIYGSYEIK